MENCYRLIGFLADYKFIKGRKVQEPIKENSVVVAHVTKEGEISNVNEK